MANTMKVAFCKDVKEAALIISNKHSLEIMYPEILKENEHPARAGYEKVKLTHKWCGYKVGEKDWMVYIGHNFGQSTVKNDLIEITDSLQTTTDIRSFLVLSFPGHNHYSSQTLYVIRGFLCPMES